VVAGGKGDGEAEGEEDSSGAGEEDGAVAGVADDDAGDGASEEEGEIDEGVVRAEGGAAIFDGDVADGFDGERREDQGETNSNEGRGGECGGRNSRETQKKEAEDFDKERYEGDGKAADAGDQADKEEASHDEASSIDCQREGRAAPM
jgi:hypothetical protein